MPEPEDPNPDLAVAVKSAGDQAFRAKVWLYQMHAAEQAGWAQWKMLEREKSTLHHSWKNPMNRSSPLFPPSPPKTHLISYQLLLPFLAMGMRDHPRACLMRLVIPAGICSST